MGQVCHKHNEFYETECKWCDKPPALSARDVLAAMRREAELAEAENGLRSRLGLKDWFTGVGSMNTPAAEPDLSESPLDRHGGCE